jgi:hypothetical protein
MKYRIREYTNHLGKKEFEPQWWFLWWHPFRCSYDCPIYFNSLDEAKEFLKPKNDIDIIHKF